MTDLETKRKHIETAMKILGLGALCLILGPVYLTLLHGLGALIALGIAAAGAFVVINLLPSFAAMVANWRLKALKAVAAANPIETLENRYSQLKDALLKQRENIKQRIAIASKIFDQIRSFESQFSKPSPRREQYDKLNQLVALSKNKYQNAQVNLVAFGKVIDEKRADWEIALSMAEANKLANVGEDFTAKLLQDTALNTIQDGLNTAFAELDAAVMDENIQKVLNGKESEVTVAPVTTASNTTPSSRAKPIKNLVAPTDLDFDAEEPIGANRQKIAVT